MTLRRRLRIGLLVAAIALMIAVGAFEVWLYSTFHTLDPFRPPPLIRVFGREYRSGLEMTLDQVRAHSTVLPPEILEPALGSVPLQLPREPQQNGLTRSPGMIWLHLGPDRYLAYLAAGGP